MGPMRRVFLAVGVITLLALPPLVHNVHRSALAYRPRHDLEQRILYLPSGELLAPACLGFDGMVADLLWIRAIMYFGSHHDMTEDENWYVWLYCMIDLVTDLDPDFISPFKYGGLMLHLQSDWVEPANLLMAKGMNHNPDEWFFPFTLAMNYYSREDYERAAEYAQMAAVLPDAPFYLPNLAASMLNDTDREEVSLQFLKERYSTALDEKMRDAIYVKIQETLFEIAKRDLDVARGQYRDERGREAQDLTELVPQYIAEIPDDPYAVFVDDPSRCGLSIDPLNRSVTSDCLAEALESIRERYGIGSGR